MKFKLGSFLEKNISWIFFLVCLLAIVWIIFTSETFLKVNEKISNSVLLITAAIIFWYTKETFDLRKINQKILTSSDRPLLVHARHNLPVHRTNFPDAAALYQNVGRGGAFEVFILTFKDSAWYVSDINEMPVFIASGEFYPVKNIPNSSSIKDVQNTYTNLTDLIFTKIKETGSNDVRVVFYKDLNNIWFYSSFIKKNERNEVVGSGEVNEFVLKS
jgi:hypothetical protein